MLGLVLSWFAQEAGPSASPETLISLVLQGGAPAILLYMLIEERKVSRGLADKLEKMVEREAERTERYIPVFTEFLGVLRQVRDMIPKMAEHAQTRIDEAKIDDLSHKLDDLRADLKPGGRHDR